MFIKTKKREKVDKLFLLPGFFKNFGLVKTWKIGDGNFSLDAEMNSFRTQLSGVY